MNPSLFWDRHYAPLTRTKWSISPLLIQIPVSITAGLLPVLWREALYQTVGMIATFAIIFGTRRDLCALFT